jgi:hypothetical protein
MREHTHLPAMVSFVRNHIAQHFRADRPRPSPTVSQKLLDATFFFVAAESFSEHLRATSGALGQSCSGLLGRAVGAVELSWNLQVWRGKPDPFGAGIVHMREDCRNGAGLAGRFGRRWFGRRWFGRPGGRVEMLDEHLVHAVIGGEDPDRSSTQLRVHPGLTSLGLTNPGLTCGVLTRGHGSLLLHL